jgi:hypothetical protein
MVKFSQNAILNQDPSESKVKLAGLFKENSERTLHWIEGGAIILSHNSESRTFGACSPQILFAIPPKGRIASRVRGRPALIFDSGKSRGHERSPVNDIY